MIPKSHYGNAKFLLNEFTKRGNELTWNSQGTVFIDQTSIPNSNIFVLLPLLFKRNQKSFSTIAGYDDMVQKIFDMGLSDLICAKKKNRKVVQKFENLDSKLQSESETEVPWWYLGP